MDVAALVACCEGPCAHRPFDDLGTEAFRGETARFGRRRRNTRILSAGYRDAGSASGRARGRPRSRCSLRPGRTVPGNEDGEGGLSNSTG